MKHSNPETVLYPPSSVHNLKRAKRVFFFQLRGEGSTAEILKIASSEQRRGRVTAKKHIFPAKQGVATKPIWSSHDNGVHHYESLLLGRGGE